MEEVWKNICGYEGLYQVSNLGNVKSLNYAHRGYAKNLVPKKNNSGRLWVELVKDGVKKPMLIHRLVANEFIDNPNNYPQINHKDENPTNNCVDNLEWCTGLYNIRYSLALHPERSRSRKMRKTRKIIGNEIRQIDLSGNEVCTWKDIREIVNTTGMSQWSITQCCDGKRKTAYGFRWQYAI